MCRRNKLPKEWNMALNKIMGPVLKKHYEDRKKEMMAESEQYCPGRKYVG